MRILGQMAISGRSSRLPRTEPEVWRFAIGVALNDVARFCWRKFVIESARKADAGS
jgi:hypothetical protein